MHVYIHIQINMCIHTYTYIHVNIYMYMHIFTTHDQDFKTARAGEKRSVCSFSLARTIRSSNYWVLHRISIHTYVYIDMFFRMWWLRFVGSLKLLVSCAKEPYKRDYILQEKPTTSRGLLIVATA